MGQLKEWAMTDQECIVCGQPFQPALVMHEIDIAMPTCSRACYNEYIGVMESIADMQEEQARGDEMLPPE